MPNPQDIFQLAQQTATQVTASPENWRRFLYTAAHNYHTTYLNQLLIHAQRPDATACATMKYWNEQAHRKVMYGSKSIIILQRHQGVPTAKRVFSMTDTVLTGDKAAAPWEVTDAIRPLLMQVNSVGSLMDRATEQVVSLSDRANRVLATSIEDSALNWSHPEDQRFILQEVAAQSTLYMICIRLGIPVQEEDFPAFQNVTQFDTSRISLCLGGYVQAAAEPLLDELGHEVMQLARDSVAIQAEPVHNTDTQSPTQTTSREEAVTDDVHEREGLSDSESELAESQENQPEPVRQNAAGLLGAERAEPLRPDDAGGNAAAKLPQDGAGRAADGGQDAARPDAESANAQPQDKPAGLGADVQQPEAAGGGNDPSDAVRSITEEPAAAESEPSPSAFSLPEFPAELLPSLLKADTTSRASNAEILSFFSKTPLLIDRLRYIRESYKVVFTELLLEDDTRVGFYKESNGLLVWQGSYLTRSAESHLSWHSVTAAISALVDNHELIAAIDPKKAVNQDEQLSFDLPENASRGDEVGALEVDDIYSEEEQDEKIKAALPTYHYKEPQPDDGSHITEDDVNVIITRGSIFEGGKYRIYNHFQQKKTEKETVAFLKKEYGIGGFSWTFADGGSGFVNFDGKGFSILYDFKDDLRYEKKLKWKEVGKRLEYLVRMDRYLTDAEREKMPAWINRQAESKPLPPPISDQKPVCEVGSTVYLENDQRFTVESIGQFDIHLRNEDFPLVGRAVSREQFQQLLDANPRNDGMVLSEQQRESLVQEQREQALSYIEDYLKDEFEITEPDFSNLTQIGLGYTTTEDEQHTIQVNADLEHCTISKFVDDTLYAQEKFSSLEEMNRKFLSILDFDSLMEVDINEIEEQEPEISADEPEESTFVSQVMQDVDRLAAHEEPAEYDRTNYLAPYEPAIPEGAKAKFAANVQAIRTLKGIEQRMASGGAPASEQEQDILAGYLGWGGLADAFDPGKDNWHTEYEQLKTLLTEDEYAAARESTLTAFYTPPAVIHAMYRALEHIGCVGGNVLEPSMGVGAFFGHRHSKFDTHNAKLYGVELDSLSGRIAQQLYQKAKIQITGYEKADLPDNFFDLAIGNVPFGQYQVSDRRYDKLHFQIHDYFLAKTVDKLRVGGIMAFITTSGTLDKKSEDVRQYLAARCDLIGAVRLPNTTFKSNAGTEVTSDILFLQKRGRVLEQDAPWIHVGETENGIPLNQYFIDHPEMVCGEMQMVSGPYGMRSTCVPNEQSPLAEQLDAALSTLHAEYTLVDEQEYAEEESGTIDADPNVRNFSYTVKDDVIYYRENSKMRVVKGGETALARIRALVPLRDTCRELIDAQLENFPDEYIQKLQARLNDQYDAYRKKYGLINSRGTASAFREDSGYFLLCSLEDLDDEGNFKGKTDMFTKRTIRPAQAVDHVDTAEESLALSLSEQGHVDLEYMSKLTGKTTETVIKDLTGIIFRDPVKVDTDGNPMGSTVRRLSGIERLNLLHGITRPEEVMAFSYDWLLAEDSIMTKDFIAPSGYNWKPEHDDSRAVYNDRYQFGEYYGKVLYLRDIAPQMKDNLLSLLSDLDFDNAISIHVDAVEQREAVEQVQKQLAYMQKEKGDGMVNAVRMNLPAYMGVRYELTNQIEDAEELLDNLHNYNQKIFKVCILIHTYGRNNAELDERVQQICNTVQQQTCRFSPIPFEQCAAMNSVLPLGKKWLALERTLLTVNTAIYVPFTTQELFQPGGLYEGTNARSKNLIMVNRKLLPAPAGMVLGMTGFGKSFAVMQMMAGIMLRWPEDDLVIIDPENEYARLVEAFGGEVIEISASSKSHINPMDISEDYGDEGNPIQLKSQFLRDFCQLVLNSKELSAQECSLVDRAALITYQKYLLHPEREQMPSLHDFYNNLSLQGSQAKALTMALSMYVDGTMDLFAHQTNVDLQNHCICFNTVKLGKSMQSIGMMTVLDQIWNRITRNRVLGRRTWIFTDEFQLLLGNSACTNYYFELSSRARKWGAILTSITQHVRSVLNNEDARRMLSDCGYIKLLNQAPDDANDIARLLHISDEEKRYIENAEVGSGLLIADKVVVPFNNTFPQDTELFRLMDTNPNRKK